MREGERRGRGEGEMDPDRLREELLELARVVLIKADMPFEAWQLAAKVQDLDEWLQRGGFPPVAWRKDQ